MRPVCVPCKATMQPEKNGFAVVSMAPDSFEDGAPVSPYQVWHGDKWKCRECGAEVVTGFGTKPIAESHEDSFKRALTYYKPLEVTDT